MNGPELAEVIETARVTTKRASELLGYRSENSLRQVLAGAAVLSSSRAAWLRRYARLRARHAAEESEWLAKNPAPDA